MVEAIKQGSHKGGKATLTRFTSDPQIKSKNEACLRGGGDQNSSTGNHRQANVFCGKLAPQLVISIT